MFKVNDMVKVWFRGDLKKAKIWAKDADDIYTVKLQEAPFYKIDLEEEDLIEIEQEEDLVNHPNHYTQGKIEVIEAIEDWKLGYHLGNAIKYIARCEHKGNKEQDLKKAIWYLERELKCND